MDQRAKFRQGSRRSGSSRTETLIGTSILVFLALIAAAILLKQSRFDEDTYNALVMQTGQVGPGEGETSPDASAIGISEIAPGGFSPMSDVETFDQVSLSDKIDGKADGYLDAGFLQLTSQRFMSDAHPDQWFEFYLYDMDVPRNAFSIYSKQKRDGVADQDFTEFAYASENAVFFATGKYYVEIIAAAQDEALLANMIQMSKRFVQEHATITVTLPELAYLPVDGLDSESVSLIPKDGFGYSKFDNIFTGTYQIGDQRIMAFLSIRESPEAAADLVKGYDAILSEFVGDDRLEPETQEIPGLLIVDLFGEYELFFAEGNIIAGVHGAADRALGEQIAINLYHQISDVIQ